MGVKQSKEHSHKSDDIMKEKMDETSIKPTSHESNTFAQREDLERQRSRGLGTRSSLFHVIWFINGIKKVFKNPKTRIIHCCVDIIVDIIFCGIYVVDAESHSHTNRWYLVKRDHALWGIAVILSIYGIFSLVVRLLVSRSRLWMVLTVKTAIDLLTAIPFIVSIVLEAQSDLQFYIPYYLRAWIISWNVKKLIEFNEEYRIFGMSKIPFIHIH
jgi:hypothetical protein